MQDCQPSAGVPVDPAVQFQRVALVDDDELAVGHQVLHLARREETVAVHGRCGGRARRSEGARGRRGRGGRAFCREGGARIPAFWKAQPAYTPHLPIYRRYWTLITCESPFSLSAGWTMLVQLKLRPFAASGPHTPSVHRLEKSQAAKAPPAQSVRFVSPAMGNYRVFASHKLRSAGPTRVTRIRVKGEAGRIACAPVFV